MGWLAPLYSTVAVVPLAVKVVVPVPAPVLSIGFEPAILKYPLCAPVASVTVPIGLVVGALAPGKLYNTFPPSAVLPEASAKVALFCTEPVELVGLISCRSLVTFRFDKVEVSVVVLVTEDDAGLSAINIPPFLSAVESVAEPPPVAPAEDLIAHAAPTDAEVDWLSYNSVNAPGEDVLHPDQV